MAILETISGMPDALRGGIYWLILINSLSVVFILWRVEARVILGLWAILALTAIAMAEQNMAPGATGAAAALLWVPLLFWLIWRNPVEDAGEPWGLYLVLLFTSNLVATALALANLRVQAV